MGHDVGSSAERAHWHAATDDLGQSGDIRRHARYTLHTLWSRAKARHDFIENQKSVVLRTQTTQPFQKVVDGLNEVHIARNGLDDDADNVLAVLLERGVNG